MINAFAPGPASIQEKRAAVSLDFFEHARVSGQSFKFYPVHSLASNSSSPATAQDSGYASSSFDVSPVMTTWDWSNVSPAPSSSKTSNVRRQSPKASRQETTDFSHLPGMKIMTKDGRDVTNSASRGSKTKEQRDHAHLMRIIKACDSCRRKKIRCDPSHKRRSASSQAQPQSSTISRPAKKSKAVSQKPPPAAAPVVVDPVSTPLDSLSAFENMPEFDALSSAPSLEPWEQFIQYPPSGLGEEYDFFTDPEGYLSPVSSSSASASPSKVFTPTSHHDGHTTSDSSALDNVQPVGTSPMLPFEYFDSASNYTDFNLYSPQSSFSEDDRMVPIERSSTNSSDQPVKSLAQHPQPDISPNTDGGELAPFRDARPNLVTSPQSLFNRNSTSHLDHQDSSGSVRLSSIALPSGSDAIDWFDSSSGGLDIASSIPSGSGVDHDVAVHTDFAQRDNNHVLQTWETLSERTIRENVSLQKAIPAFNGQLTVSKASENMLPDEAIRNVGVSATTSVNATSLHAVSDGSVFQAWPFLTVFKEQSRSVPNGAVIEDNSRPDTASVLHVSNRMRDSAPATNTTVLGRAFASEGITEPFAIAQNSQGQSLWSTRQSGNTRQSPSTAHAAAPSQTYIKSTTITTTTEQAPITKECYLGTTCSTCHTDNVGTTSVAFAQQGPSDRYESWDGSMQIYGSEVTRNAPTEKKASEKKASQLSWARRHSLSLLMTALVVGCGAVLFARGKDSGNKMTEQLLFAAILITFMSCLDDASMPQGIGLVKACLEGGLAGAWNSLDSRVVGASSGRFQRRSRGPQHLMPLGRLVMAAV